MYCFKPGFIGFAGHFPQSPILPALVQILMGQNLAVEAHNTELDLLEIKAAKFLEPVLPDQEIEISAVFSKEDDRLISTNKLFRQDKPVASFRLVMQIRS